MLKSEHRQAVEDMKTERERRVEEAVAGRDANAAAGRDAVDPVDGTFNYQRGLPLYAVSIGYCEEGIPVCGAIYLPALDELFFAAQGSGAFLAKHDLASPVPLRISQEREWARLVISVAGGAPPF